MVNTYQNVNTSELESKLEAIQTEIEILNKRILHIDSISHLPINQVLLGECLDLLKTLPDNSVDCIVTDPPYGLGKVKSITALLQSWLEGKDGREHHTNGFMGEKWDILPSPNVWREVLRVLKPGGYALVFAGTRTVDLMGLSLRLAGFELQDNLVWIQSQGFPKGKTQLKPSNEPILMAYKSGTRVLNIDECRIGVSVEDTHLRWNETKHKGNPTLYKGGFKNPITYPHSATESGRYPSNVLLSHNPDCVACGTKEVKTESGSALRNNQSKSWFNQLAPIQAVGTGSKETIAAYQCSDSCPVRLLDEQTVQMRASKPSGASTHGNGRRLNGNGVYSDYENKHKGESIDKGDGDGTANASRFFLNLSPEAPFIYQPKASKSDRSVNGKVENTHTTVKPTNLMAYLIRLVCPVDGIVLDPFMGSGSTALGCLKEDRYYIGMEQSEEYHGIALERIKHFTP